VAAIGTSVNVVRPTVPCKMQYSWRYMPIASPLRQRPTSPGGGAAESD
jgi:hypothetical protein